MAEKVTRWKSADGKVYDTYLEAVKADAAYWEKKFRDLSEWRAKDQPVSRYGSSGGGGHD